MAMAKPKYTIRFHFNGPADSGVNEPRTFASRAEVKAWIMDGMRGTEGAERDHYVDLMLQLERGKRDLNYN